MKIAGIIVSVLILVIGVLGVIAPTDMIIERDIVIDKAKNIVFADLSMMKNHSHWSPWQKRDQQIQMTYLNTDGAVGAIMSWSGNKEVGVGEQEITKISDGDRIDYEVRFKEPMETSAQTWLITEPLGENQTKVRWGFSGKNPFPLNILCMVLNMDKMMKKDMDEGLTSMKQHLEGGPQH